MKLVGHYPCSYWTSSAATQKITVTGFVEMLPCVLTWTCILQRLRRVLQRVRGRLIGRSCFKWPCKNTVAVRKWLATSLGLLGLHHRRGKLTEKSVNNAWI